MLGQIESTAERCQLNVDWHTVKSLLTANPFLLAGIILLLDAEQLSTDAGRQFVSETSAYLANCRRVTMIEATLHGRRRCSFNLLCKISVPRGGRKSREYGEKFLHQILEWGRLSMYFYRISFYVR